MARGRIAALSAVGVAGVAGTAVVLTTGGGDDAQAAPATQATATAEVRRQDLVETEEVDGTLGYSDARTVVNRLSGTVTWTPGAGRTVRTNHRLYEVDGQAVYLLDGAAPAYRTLEPGTRGDDVRQLERNLRELGLDPGEDMRVDGRWDAGTTAAVERWQERKGLDADGSIEAGRIVFQPGARRVGSIAIPVGSSASSGGGGGATQPTAADAGEATLVTAALTSAPGSRGWSDIGGDTGTPETTLVQDTGATGATGPTGATGATGAPPPARQQDEAGTPPDAARATPERDAAPEGATRGTAPQGAAPQAAAGQTATPRAAAPQGGGTAPATSSASGADGSGAPAASAEVATSLMTTTSTKRIVTVDLETKDVRLAERGAEVQVELPGGEEVAGTIARVGTVARQAASQDPNNEEPATVKLIVRIKGAAGTRLDQAPVDVRLEQRRARRVLTVPVTALLARGGGTFAVEVRDGGRRRLIAVETGMYTSGDVEVQGRGLAAGMTVTNAEV